MALDVISRFLFANDMIIYLVMFGCTEYLASKKLFRDIQEYIDDVYAASHYSNNTELARRKLWQEDEYAALRLDQQLQAMNNHASVDADISKPDLDRVLKKTNESFSDALLRPIDEKNLVDAL